MKQIEGNLIDIHNREIYPCSIEIEDEKILNISRNNNKYEIYILPGFIDSHIHIESSLLIPSEFSRLASVHGTVATVSDPHEIANVCGMDGVRFMIENGKKVPFHFFFGAPSCVPATSFETAGAEITSVEIEELMSKEEILYLSEMMNFPGVIYEDANVLEKISIAHKYNKPIDGHVPNLRGELLDKYLSKGISTDHEAFTYEEGLEKLQKGMKILIREGSAAKNFDALIPLLKDFPNEIMFCSDDKHPDSLLLGHINQLVAKAIHLGYDMFDVLRAASLNPIQHYNLPVGILRIGDSADFITIKNLNEMEIDETFVKGELIAKEGKSFIQSIPETPINQFNSYEVKESDIQVTATSNKIRVINVIEGQLITQESIEEVPIENGLLTSNTNLDILKLVVVNRYNQATPAVAFVKNFGLKKGAIASTVAHDSHNIIAVGVRDEDIIKSIQLLMEAKGGLSVVSDVILNVLPLPVAGLMSNEDGYKVAEQYIEIDKMAKGLGTPLKAPFMTLSFLALLVIPEIKLSDKGLFNGNSFQFTSLFAN